MIRAVPVFIAAILLTVGGQSYAHALSSEDAKTAIEQVLRAQQDAWNRHDLDTFMKGYWNSAELTFFSGAKERQGWQATIERYRAAYASPGHEMGHLEFSDLRIEMLGWIRPWCADRGSSRCPTTRRHTDCSRWCFVNFPTGGRSYTTTLRRRNEILVLLCVI